MTHAENKYDVALSFAGEDRSCAEAVAESLRGRNINVFYDKYEKASLWGKDLYVHLSNVYQKQALYCVMFVSKFYAEKLWTKHERQFAQAKAFKNTEYILPIRLDDTEIPGLPPTVGYLDWATETPSSIADAIIRKLGKESLREFVFEYHFPPVPGLRKWFQLDEVKWVEQYPNGHTSTFVVVDKITIENTVGCVVRKVGGELWPTLVPDFALEIFIPNPDSSNMNLLFRHNFDGGWQAWKPSGKITYINSTTHRSSND